MAHHIWHCPQTQRRHGVDGMPRCLVYAGSAPERLVGGLPRSGRTVAAWCDEALGGRVDEVVTDGGRRQWGQEGAETVGVYWETDDPRKRWCVLIGASQTAKRADTFCAAWLLCDARSWVVIFMDPSQAKHQLEAMQQGRRPWGGTRRSGCRSGNASGS